jgi:hypothetical protein
MFIFTIIHTDLPEMPLFIFFLDKPEKDSASNGNTAANRRAFRSGFCQPE